MEYLIEMTDTLYHRKSNFVGPIRWVAVCFGCLLWAAMGTVALAAYAPAPEGDDENDTLLMFVGEKLDVLSIATGRVEGARQAPAIARVITREQIRELGFTTLSEALSLVPGFYMAEKEGGTQPYLRGISNSILFLYDTVPLDSEVTKSLHALDHEISLDAIKRIEIVRGPGSVLWGPDAFAGVVNIVPLNGQDVRGGETGLHYGSPGEHAGAYVNAGSRTEMWDTFVSVNARKGQEDDTPADIVRFWGDGVTAVPPADRTGLDEPDDAQYLEAIGRIAYDERIFLSGRFSGYNRPYTLVDQGSGLSWGESKKASSGFVKLEAKQPLHMNSAVRFKGSYSWLNPEYEIIDGSQEQQERRFFAEMVYDHAFVAGRNLLTAGVSYRENRVEDAPIWDGFLPAYLGPDNESLLPLLEQVDYDTRLASMFGQYSHKFGEIDVLLGLRYDHHDAYNDSTSYNAAAVWSPSSQWVLKMVHGTAFRTPYARQLHEEGEAIDPEKITNTSLQLAWKPDTTFNAAVSLFNNRIENHVLEDPYAGLSEPNNQDIYGIEAEICFQPWDTVNFSANLTILQNSGPDENYWYNDFTYIDEDGNVVKHYVKLEYPYDTGARQLFNLTGTWRPLDRLTTTAMLRYIGSRDFIYPIEDTLTTCEAVWLLDWSATVHRLFHPDVDLTLSVKNLLDETYRTPGTYSTIEGIPLTVQATLRWKW